MAYDPAIGQMVLFGGTTFNNPGGTWLFDGTTWTQASPTSSPPPLSFASMAYDPAAGSMVLFGGSRHGDDLNDTWTFTGYDLDASVPAHEPPARSYASMAYDPAAGSMVLFGGSGAVQRPQRHLDLNGTTWTEAFAGDQPFVRGTVPPWPTTRPPGP